MPKSPRAKPLARARTLRLAAMVPVTAGVQVTGLNTLPDCCSRVWSAPPAYTLPLPSPHTACRSAEVPEVTVAQDAPPHLTMVPPAPTAYTSLEEAPQTAFRSLVTPVLVVFQVPADSMAAAPALPTAKTALAELPHTALICPVNPGTLTTDHCLEL